MRPRKILSKKQAMIEASEVYLAEPFPEELANLPLSEVLAFIDIARFDFLESLKPEQVFEEIEALAETFLRLVSEYAYGEEVEKGFQTSEETTKMLEELEPSGDSHAHFSFGPEGVEGSIEKDH